MFMEEWDKPFWRDLRLNVNIDFGYYTGSGQWDPATKAKQLEAKKPALVLNHIKPACKIIFGLERLNRYDPQAKPEGKDDIEVAAVFTRLMKKTMQDTHGEYVLSDGFEDGVICGVVAYELPITFTRDAINGEIDFQTVRVPQELMWSTPWKKYDLSDCRAVWRHKWVDVDDLCAYYPRHKAAILAGLEEVSMVDVKEAGQQPVMLTQGDPHDPYKADDEVRAQDDRDFWFDEKKGRVRVLESYYPVYEPIWLLATQDGRRVIQSTNEVKLKRIFQELVLRNPEAQITLLQRNVRHIEMLVVLAATEHILEQGVPFPKDPDRYPFIPFFADWKRDEIFGVVRSLRDPQDEVNARRSQISWLTKATGDGWFVDQESLVEPEKFQSESRDPKGVYLVKKGVNVKDPRRMPPPNIPQGLFEILREAVNEIRSISLVNADLQGLREGHPSGVAMARADLRGQTGTASYFDNYRLTRYLIYEKMARRCQEVYSNERIVRLYNPQTHEDEWIPINTPEAPPEENQEGLKAQVRSRILNDISTLKYDIVLAEQPASPTQRDAALRTIIELLQKVPGAAPFLMETIFELTDGLPNRERLLAKIQKFVEGLEASGPPPPKVNISLRGELDPGTAQDLADDAQLNRSTDPAEKLGEKLGNAQNPSGQLPVGGESLDKRPDLPPAV